MIGEGISYTNAKTYNNKKITCEVCNMAYNSMDNANDCTNTADCQAIRIWEES